jgi:acetyl esterase/lipase
MSKYPIIGGDAASHAVPQAVRSEAGSPKRQKGRNRWVLPRAGRAARLLIGLLAPVCTTLGSVSIHAQASIPIPQSIRTPSLPGTIPLDSGAGNGSAGGTEENWASVDGQERSVRNVTRPTLTAILPDSAKATGAAVVIVPGGAFMLLSIDKEGLQVGRALAARGIAAFVLKYRVMPTPADEQAALDAIRRRLAASLADPTGPAALHYPPATQDLIAALALVRARASTWHVDPERVGILGFSAGAIAALDATLAAPRDKQPAFLGYIYGPQTRVAVPAVAPPLFAAIAFDDPLFPTGGFALAEAWHAAARSVELHAYQRGGHGFGQGVPGTTTTLMVDNFVAWLAMQQLSAARSPDR